MAPTDRSEWIQRGNRVRPCYKRGQFRSTLTRKAGAEVTDHQTRLKWAFVLGLCVVAFAVGYGVNPAYAGCGSGEECTECVIDECNGGEYTSGYGVKCQGCCSQQCPGEPPEWEFTCTCEPV